MLRILIIIFSLISFLLSIYYSRNISYQYIYGLPLGLALFAFSQRFTFPNLKKSYVYYIFYFQAVIRYCVIPLGISMGDSFTSGFFSYNANLAVLFMLIELFSIWCVFVFQNKNCRNLFKASKLILVKKNLWLYGMVSVMFLIVYSSGYLNKVNLIWNLSSYIEDAIEGNLEDISSFGALLFGPLKVALILIVTSWVLSSSLSKKIKIVLLVVVMGGASIFIVGMSRLSIVTFLLPFYFILRTILNKKSIKFINISLLALMMPVLLMTSVAKFSRGETEASAETVLNTNSYNAYFAGPGNVAVGIDAYESMPRKNHFLFFINDTFQNVPLLSKLTDNIYKSNYVFNYKVYGHSLWQTQIVPLTTAGLFHFGILGVGLYSAFFIWVAMFFERKALAESYLPYKYVFFAIMLSGSMVFMLNIGSMVVTIIRSLMFVYIPFFIANKLNKIN